MTKFKKGDSVTLINNYLREVACFDTLDGYTKTIINGNKIWYTWYRKVPAGTNATIHSVCYVENVPSKVYYIRTVINGVKDTFEVNENEIDFA